MMGPSAIGAQPPPEDYDEEWLLMQEDEEGDEPFCTCSTGHGIEETDWNQCDSCGKPIYDEEPAVPPAPTFEDQAKDSERYRLLRRGQHWSVINGIGDTLRADQLDAAIDAELATHNVEFSGTPAALSPEAPLERRVGALQLTENDMGKQEKLKMCRTVGMLIAELEKLPKTAKLSDPLRPVYYNTGETAKQMGLEPQVGFEEAD